MFICYRYGKKLGDQYYKKNNLEKPIKHNLISWKKIHK